MAPKKKLVKDEFFSCMVSEGHDSNRDDVKTFAIVNSIEAARLACRDLAIKRKDEYFHFDNNRFDNNHKAEWWKEKFKSGKYNNQDICNSRNRFSIWFEGPIKVQSVNDIAQHEFKENENENEKVQLGLLSFAKDVITAILQFLTLKDVGQLDTAYCNKKKRDQLLSILSNNKSIVYDQFCCNDLFRSIDTFMKWIGNRKINIVVLSIKNKMVRDGIEGYYDNHNLTDDGLIGLTKHCSYLRSLDINHCIYITDDSMIEISRNCIHLQLLDISMCRNITDTCMTEISRHCIHLESLNIQYCKKITDISMTEIGRNCIHLKSLDIGHCRYITDITIIEIGRNCTHLESLYGDVLILKILA